jgi:hypothetical protein
LVEEGKEGTKEGPDLWEFSRSSGGQGQSWCDHVITDVTSFGKTGIPGSSHNLTQELLPARSRMRIGQLKSIDPLPIVDEGGSMVPRRHKSLIHIIRSVYKHSLLQAHESQPSSCVPQLTKSGQHCSDLDCISLGQWRNSLANWLMKSHVQLKKLSFGEQGT